MVLFNPFARAPRLRDGLPVLRGAFPVVGHLPAFLRLPDVVRTAREEVGPVFWIAMGAGQWILACSGNEALEIFRSKSFTSEHLPTVSPLVAGRSLLSQDGAAHRHMRSAMNPPFLPRGLSAGSIGAMTAGALIIQTLSWTRKGHARVLPDVQDAMLRIIFRMLGVDAADVPAWRRQYRALLLANLGIKATFPGSPAVRAARAKAWIDARFRELIAAVRADPKAEGLLADLTRGEDEAGQRLTDEELVDNLRLLVLGGHETTSATMGWMLIMLAARPALWDALTAEVGASKVPETPQAARAFPFAEALFRETLRMHPPFAMMTRYAAEPYTLHGKTIPRGTVVGIDLWSMGRDPGTFTDPHEHRPERWLGRDHAPTAIEVSQFGAGPHFCLGYHLAWLTAVQFAVALAYVLGHKGLRPKLRGAMPDPIYLPTEHPPARTVVELVTSR